MRGINYLSVELQNKGCFLSVSRFTRMRVFLFAVLSLLLSVGCCSPLRANPKGFGTAKYALVIGCDGLGEPQILLRNCTF